MAGPRTRQKLQPRTEDYIRGPYKPVPMPKYERGPYPGAPKPVPMPKYERGPYNPREHNPRYERGPYEPVPLPRGIMQMSPAQQEEYQTADASGIFNLYDQYKDKFGEFDFGDKEYSYDYEMPLGPGTLGIGGKYDFDDENAGIGLNYSMSFDKGGIASLPETKKPQPEKVPLSDDQKDYLYDYMIDFMMKQKQREQREMEGRIPPFNYEGLEV